MIKILVADSFSNAGMSILEACREIDVVSMTGLSPEKLREELHNHDGVIIRSATKLTGAILKDQPRLKLIVRAGVGVDNIDLASATHEGIVVMNTPAGNTTSTAEHTMAMMLALSRNIGPAAASMKAGEWNRKQFTGSQLSGKTLGVIGMGRVGQTVAARARMFGMTILGFDPFFSSEKAAEQGIELFRDLEEMIPSCDYLTVHTPLNAETRDLVSTSQFEIMKAGTRIINCARGGIVNEVALLQALNSSQIAGAALDVFTEEPPGKTALVEHPKVLCTPHLGASTDEAQQQVAVEAAEIVLGYFLKGEVRFAVNMVPVSGAEMEVLRPYLDLTYRLGLMLAQLRGSEHIRAANIRYRGEVAGKNTKLLTAGLTAGLLEKALDSTVNIVNANIFARERGLEIEESTLSATADFSSLVTVELVTDVQSYSISGTIFGQEFLRLVRYQHYQLETFLDGTMLIFHHHDVPGLIGYVGTVCGEYQVNISSMALGRSPETPGADSVAVLNVDGDFPSEAREKLLNHPEVTGVELVVLPPAGAALPWLVRTRQAST